MVAEAGGGPEGSVSEANCRAWGEQRKVEGEESLRVKGRSSVSTGVQEPLCSSALTALWGATPAWCSGFPPWASENRHETHVTTKSQSSGVLKHETRQQWRWSFPLCPGTAWGPAPAEPAAPTCLCEERASPPPRGWRRATPAHGPEVA